jgi:tetratricopeptide (TPR) repeat protein
MFASASVSTSASGSLLVRKATANHQESLPFSLQDDIDWDMEEDHSTLTRTTVSSSVSWEHGQHDAGDETLKKRQEVACLEDTDRHISIAQMLDGLGKLCYMQRDYPAALDYYEQAFQCWLELQSEKTDDSSSFVQGRARRSLTCISMIYQAMGCWASALFGYQTLLRLLEDRLLGDTSCEGGMEGVCAQQQRALLRRDIGRTLIKIGDVLHHGYRDSRALDSYQRARYFMLASGMLGDDISIQRVDAKVDIICR